MNKEDKIRNFVEWTIFIYVASLIFFFMFFCIIYVAPIVDGDVAGRLLFGVYSLTMLMIFFGSIAGMLVTMK
jgi:hypothetical protein